jgi:hypothetical protein
MKSRSYVAVFTLLRSSVPTISQMPSHALHSPACRLHREHHPVSLNQKYGRVTAD